MTFVNLYIRKERGIVAMWQREINWRDVQEKGVGRFR